MTRVASILILSAGFSGAQIFYSEEEFYRYLENRQKMALVEVQAAEFAREQAAAQRQTARAREHERVMEAVQDELDAQALEAIQWLREHPSR
jgi:hypothetical protein